MGDARGEESVCVTVSSMSGIVVAMRIRSNQGAELTSEGIRQVIFQFFLAGFFHGFLPSCTQSSSATTGLWRWRNTASYRASS